ncbi:gamma-glutamyl-gamma-aminobutyrate hydrolase family protein [Planococcus versutus]|uniref:Gamma-glutamyl-gamma-aminobutyrate hydrolase n=1 Tax=Planococcus versutus TaxID=1302659 RepID=A0A1B1S298_9BACL|nr:gamma-glutamyl-gamma-aminobutyrate hydrolase family protein [Planococcus versutus]ANU27313.1 gamma-glutamyl-gamma-aminobutyrate hydrolase [Planococcus versutus]
MKPVIGITASLELGRDNYGIELADTQAILAAGGLPIMLPHLAEEDIAGIAERIDGLFLAGGYDVDPTLFNEEPHPNLGVIIPSRDAFELALAKKVMTLNKPILGVCRGAQILNIAVGGDMYQDIPTQASGSLLQHQQKAPRFHASHFVDITEGSLLQRLTNSTRIKVNSRHHQANRLVPAPLIISGISSDGIVEAVECRQQSFVLGVQWHPENMAIAEDAASKGIFAGFIKACREKETGK